MQTLFTVSAPFHGVWCDAVTGNGQVLMGQTAPKVVNIVNQISFEKILRGNPHHSFVVNFRCKPFWYPERIAPITLTASGTFITNPGNVGSEPLITVYGSGDITLMVGMTITELFGIFGSITLDTPLMEAYSGDASANSHMSRDLPIPFHGTNAISWSGSVTKIEVRPNWRYLLCGSEFVLHAGTRL